LRKSFERPLLLMLTC